MKKFSTAALILALAPALSAAAPAGGHETTEGRCAFRANAPAQHVVVRGDTLWDIAGRFLAHPWCWPRVWGMNRDEIRNPHWIYPGQVIYFDRVAGRLHLGGNGGAAGTVGGIPTVRLAPQVRSEPLAREAVPAIPAHVIEPFLSRPLIVEENALQATPRIVATQEGRVLLGKGDLAYVLGALENVTDFQVFRPATPLRDPVTGALLAYEAAYLGTARVERTGQAPDEAHTLRVTSMQREMGVGDRLVPMPPLAVLNYVPRPPEQPIEARIVSIYGGVSQAGQNQVVSINRGRSHGLEVGHVLDLYRDGGSIVDRTAPASRSRFGGAEPQLVRLPDHRYGALFVFRVFDNVSYGLVMEVSDSVQISDFARSPE